MSDNWAVFPMEGEGEETLYVTMNLGLAEDAPDAERPLCVIVRVPFREPGEDGLGDPGEREGIAELEDAFERAGEGVKLRQFASVRGAGGVEAWYYCAAGAEEALTEAAGEAFDPYEVELGVGDDPEWAQYANLYPTGVALRYCLDGQLVQQLTEMGDDVETPRPVEHFAYFPAEAGARAYVEAAAAEGFAPSPEAPGVAEVEGDEGSDDDAGLRYSARLVREDPVELTHIAEVTAALSELAEAHGGSYDGWETPLVRAEGAGDAGSPSDN